MQIIDKILIVTLLGFSALITTPSLARDKGPPPRIEKLSFDELPERVKERLKEQGVTTAEQFEEWKTNRPAPPQRGSRPSRGSRTSE